jgi:hypothetical protein
MQARLVNVGETPGSCRPIAVLAAAQEARHRARTCYRDFAQNVGEKSQL